MSFFEGLLERIKRYFSSTQNVQRTIWIALGALAVLVVVFGGYYYWDRYVRLGDKSPLDLSIEQLEEAIRQDPQNPDTRVALAEFYLNKGMYPKALEQAEQVLEVYPENEGALLIAGLAYVRMERREEALVPLEQFVTLRKDRPMAQNDTMLEMAYYFLGESYVKLDRPQEAIAALEAAVAISSVDADALYQLGLAYHAAGQPEAAVARYHQAVRFVPNFAEAYAGMVEGYTALGQPDFVAYARGMEAFSRQDYKAAQTHLEQATQALPGFAPAFLGLGLTYEQLGDLDAALAALQHAVETDPQDFAAQQALGRVQAAKSNQD
jgi:tetratricopeptide (TPR) repeat protein